MKWVVVHEVNGGRMFLWSCPEYIFRAIEMQGDEIPREPERRGRLRRLIDFLLRRKAPGIKVTKVQDSVLIETREA